MTGFTDAAPHHNLYAFGTDSAVRRAAGVRDANGFGAGSRAVRERFAQLRLLREVPREIRMVHQGEIRSGRAAEVAFALDRGASGAASILVTFQREGGQPPASDGARVEPGGSARMAFSLTTPGRLKISVTTAADLDTAMLTIKTGAGLLRDRSPTIGDTVWVYSVR